MCARKVSKSTLQMISQHVDVEDLYVTQTIEQSDQSLDEIIQKRYPLVLCGGGDGTAMRIMEQVHLKIKAYNAEGGDYSMPRFGLLKLGTGNGWAGLLNVPPKVNPIWELRQKHEHELRFGTFNMLEAEDRLFHFGGFGVDAMVLNDYIEFKRRFSKGFTWKVANSLWGYLIALATKSIPKVLTSNMHFKIRAINMSDEPIYRISHSKGREELNVGKGETIFQGDALMAGFGTTNYYGFKLNVFPFATSIPGYCQLLIGNPPVPKLLANIRKVWRGVYEHPDLHYFLVKQVRLELEQDAPFQLGGDPEGYHKDLDLRVSEFTVDVLDFRRHLQAKV
ncbi:MAG: diacylglycerol kinase family protein [Candidatus Alcyoniella australis]|nr:diacylglycerol kinase family protein [Candidatus Alcyoniella australis]